MKTNLNPTAKDELEELRTLLDFVETLLVLTETDERFNREHESLLRGLHKHAMLAKIYRKAVERKT